MTVPPQISGCWNSPALQGPSTLNPQLPYFIMEKQARKNQDQSQRQDQKQRPSDHGSSKPGSRSEPLLLDSEMLKLVSGGALPHGGW
jgi:hypothetical protein